MEQETNGMELLLDSAETRELLEKTRPYMEMMMQYNAALREIRTKFEVLDDEFSVRYNRNPVETIKTRVKKPLSIHEKLRCKGLSMSVESIRSGITDVAGIRVICSFVEDIYALSDMLLQQDDVRLLRRKDYIAKPKENGYRSLHLIVEVPIFLTDRKEYIPVEVQLRTIAMDFWASLEHKLKYKKDIREAEAIAAELAACAEQVASLDLHMQQIHKRIEREN